MVDKSVETMVASLAGLLAPKMVGMMDDQKVEYLVGLKVELMVEQLALVSVAGMDD